jgi:hypothetical protein
MSVVNRGGRSHKLVAKRSTTLFVGTDKNNEDASLTADHSVYFSADGRRCNEELMNVAHKKRRMNPTELDDSLAVWTPVALDEEEFVPDVSTAETDDSAAPTILAKRKKYESSVSYLTFPSLLLFTGGNYYQTDPMNLWRPLAETFLDEIVAHNALGDNDAPQLTCALCKCAYVAGASGPGRVRLFKFNDCGEFLQCGQCCVAGHARTPLHVLQVGDFVFY